MWLVVTAVAAAENTLDLYWPDGHCEARVNNLFFFAALSLLQRDFAISGLSVRHMLVLRCLKKRANFGKLR